MNSRGAFEGKQRVRVWRPSESVFMAAGLFDENVNPETGEKVSGYTRCTVLPNEFLGALHDRASMVLPPEQCSAWLGGGQGALELVAVRPDADVEGETT